jgi:hypothetical protein
MSLMGNHGYDESTDPGEVRDAQSDAEHFAQTVEEASNLTPAERAERLRAERLSVAAWETLPPELAAIKARLGVLYRRFDTADEKSADVREHHTLMLRYTELAGGLGICNTPGCLNPKQADAPWCVRESDMARQILAEIQAEEAADA